MTLEVTCPRCLGRGRVRGAVTVVGGKVLSVHHVDCGLCGGTGLFETGVAG